LLQSPFFIYRLETSGAKNPGQKTALSSYEMASRISFLLWNSAPDDQLLAAADREELQKLDKISEQVKRMIADPRAKDTIRDFYTQWLELWRLGSVSKTVQMPQGANWSQIQELMKKEATALMDDIIWEQKNMLAFFTVPYTYTNNQLASFYGFTGNFTQNFTKYNYDPKKRLGAMTLGGIMAAVAVQDRSSPTKRGNFVLTKLLCASLPEVPRNVNPTAPNAVPGQTTRQRFSSLSQTAPCSTCHQITDYIGFGLENFDTLGTWRDTEQNQAIDATGTLSDGGQKLAFNGPAELSQKLSSSEQFPQCMAIQTLRYALGRSETDVDANTVANLKDAFANAKFDLVSLFTAMVTQDAFRYRIAGGSS
jgi:hypothetical protein